MEEVKEAGSFSNGTELQRLREFLVKHGISLSQIGSDQMLVDWAIGQWIKLEAEKQERWRIRLAYYAYTDGASLEIKTSLIEQRMALLEDKVRKLEPEF